MNKKINFSDVNPLSKNELTIIKKKIFQTIKKKDFILGNSVNIFEKEFSKITKINYSVGCGNGTDALVLSLMSLNLKKNDEVIVPGISYISTALCVILNNNKLVHADINDETGLISIEDVLKKITKKTKVVIPVNLYGQKVDLKKLRKKISKKIYIVEDSAQSHFAYSCYDCSKRFNQICCKRYKNDNYADISCYSFYPTKNLGAFGDGGLISTNNKKIYKKLLALRNLGATSKNHHEIIGKNSRLDTIQAVVLKEKLKSILKFNEQRREIARIYDEKLNSINQIKLTKTHPGATRHLYVIRTKKRDNLIKHLKSKKIMCQIHYPYSLNRLKPLIQKKIIHKLNNSEDWAKSCVSLPIYPTLKLNDVTFISKVIKKYFKYK